MKMLEKWEKESDSFLLGDEKAKLLNEGTSDSYLDLNAPSKEIDIQDADSDGKFDKFFD